LSSTDFGDMQLPFPDIYWLVQQVSVWMESEQIKPEKADSLVAHIFGNWAMSCYMKHRQTEQVLAEWDDAGDSWPRKGSTGLPRSQNVWRSAKSP
jgi:hypothetical protein